MSGFLDPFRCPRGGKSADRPSLKAGWLAAAPLVGDQATPKDCQIRETVVAGDDCLAVPSRPGSAQIARRSPTGRPGSAPQRPWRRRPESGNKCGRMLLGGESAGQSLLMNQRRPLSARGDSKDMEDGNMVQERVLACNPADRSASADRAQVSRMIMVLSRITSQQASQARIASQTEATEDEDLFGYMPRCSVKKYESMFQSCLRSSRRSIYNEEMPHFSEERHAGHVQSSEDALADLEVEETLKAKGIEDHPADDDIYPHGRRSALVREIHSNLQQDAKHFNMIYASHPEVDTVDLDAETKNPYVSAIPCPPSTPYITGYDSRTSTPVTSQNEDIRMDIPRPPARPSTPGRYCVEIRGTPPLVPPYRSPSPAEIEPAMLNHPKFSVATIRRWFDCVDKAKNGRISRRQLLFALNGNRSIYNVFCAADIYKAHIEKTSRAITPCGREEFKGIDGVWYSKEDWEMRIIFMRRGIDALDRLHEEWMASKHLTTPAGKRSVARSFVFEEFISYFKSQDLLAEYATQPSLNWNYDSTPTQDDVDSKRWKHRQALPAGDGQETLLADSAEEKVPEDGSWTPSMMIPALEAISPTPNAASSAPDQSASETIAADDLMPVHRTHNVF